MERDRWRLIVTAVAVAGLLLGLVGTVLGIHSLGRTDSGPEPATSLVTPTNGAVLSGMTGLDATAITPTTVTAVQFLATGGTLHDAKIATAGLAIIGWVAKWDTTTVPNGSYTVVSVGYNSAGHSSRSSGVAITVKN
jgi:hypothetical protein